MKEEEEDGQRRLEEELKEVCNTFINTVSADFLGFLDPTSGIADLETKEDDTLLQLREKMAIYLDAETVNILFNPIKRKICNGLEDAAKGSEDEEVKRQLTDSAEKVRKM